jgi:hypothetical protein
LDVAQSYQVEKDLDRLIERRSQNGEQEPDEHDRLWRESLERHNERLRRQNVAAWFAFFCRQADAHRKLSESYEARAEELCEEGEA